MKVLYIGVYKDGTGWGHAACDYITALHQAGVDVVIRPIKLNDINYSPPSFFYQLEQKNLQGVDVCIQHLLPEHMEYTSRCKSIGLFPVETDDIYYSGWSNYVNLMDGAIVISNFSKKVCENSHVNVPVFPIGQPVDLIKYKLKYEPFPIPDLQKTFNFYFISEFHPRKNIGALLTAFHTEFDPDEPVNLLIKTSGDFRQLDDFFTKVKSGLKLYPSLENYKREYVIGNFLSDPEIMQIHKLGDCFIMPSYGEGWNMPAFDAMAMGNTPIVTNCGGMTDFITDETGWLIDYTEQPCFGAMNALPNIYTARENWYSIHINKLRKAMREAYENRELKATKAEAGKKKAEEFSYQVIGNKLKKYLEEICG